MEKLQLYFSELASLFGYKYDDSFFEYLKSISTPNNTICGKRIIEDEGCWECKNCQITTNSIYCNGCFVKEKHEGHEIYFYPSDTGVCDCGDATALKREGFCDKHKGDYDNIKDLMNYIKSSIDEKLLNNINEIFNKIFLLFIELMQNLYDNRYEIFDMLDNLEIFCDKLYNNNLSLFYFFTLKFTENYPYETNHKCFSYDENKKLITFIKSNKENKHICICPFMQIMIYLLIKRNNRQSSQYFFNLFLQTYKNKTITALCYLNCFSKLFFNDNMKSFREMEYQLINENFCTLIYQDQNIPFLEIFFEEIYSLFKFFLVKKLYRNLYEASYRFYIINKYLPRKTTIDRINSNTKIINIIIDTCCLINNEIIFENNNARIDSFINFQFEENLIYSELFFLFVIICLTHLINFDNEKITKFIFNKIFEKINEFKKYKESLSKKYIILI